MMPVVRVGDTVRRGAGAWTDSVHDLLRHVRARGVVWVPEPRGRDAPDREVLRYIEGDVPSYPMPDWVWDDSVLAAAARLLRQYHDATVDFPRARRSWQLPAHDPDEVICHNDFAPYNFVFRGRVLHGVIDFDTASPGPRAWDLSYLAYRLVPLAGPGNRDALASSDRSRAARLRRLCAAYGDGATPAAVLALAPARLDELAVLTAARAGDGGGAELQRHVGVYQADASYIREHRSTLLANGRS
jgi:Ser/Thr protein kinase RdoA (MazF antagonist)